MLKFQASALSQWWGVGGGGLGRRDNQGTSLVTPAQSPEHTETKVGFQPQTLSCNCGKHVGEEEQMQTWTRVIHS